MKLIILFLSISLLVQVNPLNDCHADDGHETEVTSAVEGKVSSMPCHEEKPDKKEHSSSMPCSDCFSVCCHLSVIEQITFTPSILTHSVVNSNNWPRIIQYKDSFYEENFRPPIFG